MAVARLTLFCTDYRPLDLTLIRHRRRIKNSALPQIVASLFSSAAIALRLGNRYVDRAFSLATELDKRTKSSGAPSTDFALAVDDSEEKHRYNPRD